MNLEHDRSPTGLFDYLPKRERTIRRKGYTATRRGKTIRVRGRNIKDVGAPGKWKDVTGKQGIGPLKQGELKAVGYSVTAKAPTRHRAVDRAVKKYGKLSTLRKLNAVSVYTRRTSPLKSRKFKSDVRYVQKKYY
jgi:hypothetical protein